MSQQHPQPTPFGKLPLELLLRATADLSTTDLCSLRLTCRSIENALHHSFAREFFTKKQFMLTYPSLHALLDISTSRLGVCLEHVIIGLDHYNSPVFHNFPTTDTERAKMSKYVLGHDHQRALLDSGEAVDLLGRAFAHLPGLRVVGIRDYASAARDGRDPGTRWQSYGATTVRLDTGINLLDANASRVYTVRPDQGRVREYVTQVFRTVLLALGSVSATSKVLPTSIEVLRHDFGHLVPGAFLVPESQKPRILPVLSKIETIFLPIRLASNTPNMNTPNSGTMSDHHVRVFLSYMPNLRHLRINMGFGDLLNLRFLRWLGEPVDANASSQVNHNGQVNNNNNGQVNNGQVQQAQVDPTYGLPLPAEPVSFPHLEELNLGFCFVEPDALLAIIRKFAPTLRRLELWKLTLAPFMDMANRPDVNTGPACIWPAFLKRLRDIPGLDLRHLMIGEPRQDCIMTPHGPDVEAVQFKSLDGGPPQSFRVVQKRSYTGIDWRHFVKELEKDMHVIRVTAPNDDSGDSDEEMDSDDDNDDDDDDDDDDSEDDDGI